jgi:hypothetical protein
MMFAIHNVVRISWQFSKERVPSLRHNNKVKGIFVTTGARIHLYSCLDRLQEKAIYCDTDSVLYTQPNEGPGLVETGTFWGR